MPTFQTPEPIAVTIDLPSSSVMVTAEDSAQTVVEIRPTDASKKDDVRAVDQVQVDFSAGTLTVKIPKDWRAYTPFGGKPGSVDVTIEVPTGSRLRAAVSQGRILGVGVLGQCELEVVSGDITVDRPLGSVTAKTTKGNISIGEAARGALRLETSMGELEVGIRPGAAARLETNTRYGTVRNLMEPVERPLDNADTVHVYARNSYGGITIRHATIA